MQNFASVDVAAEVAKLDRSWADWRKLSFDSSARSGPAAGHLFNWKVVAVNERSHSEAQPAPEILALIRTLEVRRDGFDFHIRFKTKFGESKDEKLEDALKRLASIGVFKPHITVQKTGIRLAVTSWDGDRFVEEQGIENLEHASPAEVERVLRQYMYGGANQSFSGGRPSQAPSVERLELGRQPNEKFFHLVLHWDNGQTSQGPLLIRANLSKCKEFGFPPPGVTLAMTIMSDRLIIEKASSDPGQPAKTTSSFPLTTADEAKAAEQALNEILQEAKNRKSAAEPLSPLPPPPAVQAAPAPPELAPQSAPPPPQVPQPKQEAAPPKVVPAKTETNSPVAAPPKPAAPPPPPKPQTPTIPAWIGDLLKQTETLPPEEINREVFSAIQQRLQVAPQPNDHGCPTLTVSCGAPNREPLTYTLVLAPRFLICDCTFGYFRFGAETRLFLKKLDDFVEFPHQALRGLVERSDGGSVAFLVTHEFGVFLNGNSARDYKRQFEGAFHSVAEPLENSRLLWPASREDLLFRALTKSLSKFNFPVENDSIRLDASRSEFLGFRRTADAGLEFRNGGEFALFTPSHAQLETEEARYDFPGEAGLLGWALDGEGKICAIYDPSSGFSPPRENKLLRFLTPEQKASEENLQLLAWSGS